MMPLVIEKLITSLTAAAVMLQSSWIGGVVMCTHPPDCNGTATYLDHVWVELGGQ